MSLHPTPPPRVGGCVAAHEMTLAPITEPNQLQNERQEARLRAQDNVNFTLLFGSSTATHADVLRAGPLPTQLDLQRRSAAQLAKKRKSKNERLYVRGPTRYQLKRIKKKKQWQQTQKQTSARASASDNTAATPQQKKRVAAAVTTTVGERSTARGVGMVAGGTAKPKDFRAWLQQVDMLLADLGKKLYD